MINSESWYLSTKRVNRVENLRDGRCELGAVEGVKGVEVLCSILTNESALESVEGEMATVVGGAPAK